MARFPGFAQGDSEIARNERSSPSIFTAGRTVVLPSEINQNSLRSWLFCRIDALLLLRSNATQHPFHRVIAFVAGILEERSRSFFHGNLSGPRFGKLNGSFTVNS